MLNFPHEPVPALAEMGFVAFTTTRDAGTFGLAGNDPVGPVIARWSHLLAEIPGVAGIAVAPQVHGTTVLSHRSPWAGILRTPPADGHITNVPGIALAVTIADCIPIFLVHPKGAVAVLHSGWKGTAGNILREAVHILEASGFPAHALTLHLGPGICGQCYEVSPDVYAALTGHAVATPTPADLRAIIQAQARALGVRAISVSPSCTRCHNDRFYSYRAGDSGRQVAVIAVNP